MATPSSPGPPSEPLGLYEYGAIGNLETAALVGRDGSVDWACWPKFASPSVFARLLDRERGGHFRIAPRPEALGRQRYLASTNILETRFDLEGARALTVVDLMPPRTGSARRIPPTLLRIVEATGGPVEAGVEFAPRFDYAASTPELDVVARGVVARHGRERLSLRLPAPPQVSAGRAELTITIEPGRPVPIELTFGGFRSTTPGPIALFRRTERFWSRWVHGPTAPIHRIAGEWHAAVERSELVLKLLSEAGSGAFVAAPTTSLPEWPGGPRNWDYRYVWVRDSAFAAQEMLLLGHPAEARGFLAWVVRRIEAARASDNPLGVLYGAHGETDLAERELPDLSGFARSRPVRVGNAAASQFQLDVFGEILDAALLLSGLDEGFVRRRLASLLALAEVVAARWREPDQGIWEVRGPPAPYVHSKLMAWVAFDRAARLVEVLRPDGNASDRWRSEADGVRSYLLETAWDPSTGSFPQATGAAVVDAANLRIPHVGFLPYDDPKVLGTVDRVIRELGHGPFVYRYRGSDGLDGPEGTFLPCAFWLVECLARGGRRAEARDRFERLLSSASPLGLLPEEFDPDGFGPLGNFPQSLTHVALLRAAIALGFADAPASVRAELLRTMPDPSTAAGTPAPEKG